MMKKKILVCIVSVIIALFAFSGRNVYAAWRIVKMEFDTDYNGTIDAVHTITYDASAALYPKIILDFRISMLYSLQHGSTESNQTQTFATRRH